MGAIGKYGQLDPRLHHPDGTHRTTAATANGRTLERFEAAIRAHLAKHKEQEEKA